MPNGTGLKEIGPNIYAYITPEGGSNAGFAVCGEQVLVVDALMTPTLAQDFLRQIKRVTDKPLAFLVNSHYHGDHVFGNQFFLPAQIIAHVNVRRRLAQLGPDYAKQLGSRMPDLAQEMQQVRLTLPNVTYTDSLTLHLDGRTVEISYYGHAHTDGDSLVYFPAEKVLFAADILFRRIVPALMDGHCSSWISILDKLDELPAEVVVPGHGLLGTKADLKEQREFLAALRAEVTRCFEAEMTEEQAISQVKLEKYAGWLGQERYEMGIRRIYMELRGEI